MSESLKKTSIYFFLPYLSFILVLKYVVDMDQIFIIGSFANNLHFIIPSLLALFTLFMLPAKDNTCLKNIIYTGVWIAVFIIAIWYIVLHNIFFKLFDNFSFLLWGWSYLIPFVYYYRSCHKTLNERALTMYEKILRGIWVFFLIIPPLVFVVYDKYFGGMS